MFKFLGFKMRPAGASIWDHRLAALWTAADPAHRHMSPSFWLEQRHLIDSWVFEDKEGPILFFKLEGHAGADPMRAETCQMYIQFPPANARNGEERGHRMRRVRAVMVHGFEWVLRVLSQNGVREVFFDSHNEVLIRFCVKELGFNRNGARLSRAVLPQQATE
jgi:hypothetical protein